MVIEAVSSLRQWMTKLTFKTFFVYEPFKMSAALKAVAVVEWVWRSNPVTLNVGLNKFPGDIFFRWIPCTGFTEGFNCSLSLVAIDWTYFFSRLNLSMSCTENALFLDQKCTNICHSLCFHLPRNLQGSPSWVMWKPPERRKGRRESGIPGDAKCVTQIFGGWGQK